MVIGMANLINDRSGLKAHAAYVKSDLRKKDRKSMQSVSFILL